MGRISHETPVGRPEGLIDSLRAGHGSRFVLVDVAEPELRVFGLDIGDMFPVGRDGNLCVDLAWAASSQFCGRDDELGDVRRDGFGRPAKSEYAGEDESGGGHSESDGQDSGAHRRGAFRMFAMGMDAGDAGADSRSSSSIRASPISRRRRDGSLRRQRSRSDRRDAGVVAGSADQSGSRSRMEAMISVKSIR